MIGTLQVLLSLKSLKRTVMALGYKVPPTPFQVGIQMLSLFDPQIVIQWEQLLVLSG